jgi:hypothetical protein
MKLDINIKAVHFRFEFTSFFGSWLIPILNKLLMEKLEAPSLCWLFSVEGIALCELKKEGS